MILKTDCFAFRSISKDGCAALTKRDCENCRTYKSKAQVEEEQKKILEKLRAKPLTERQALAERYKIKDIL